MGRKRKGKGNAKGQGKQKIDLAKAAYVNTIAVPKKPEEPKKQILDF